MCESGTTSDSAGSPLQSLKSNTPPPPLPHTHDDFDVVDMSELGHVPIVVECCESCRVIKEQTNRVAELNDAISALQIKEVTLKALITHMDEQIKERAAMLAVINKGIEGAPLYLTTLAETCAHLTDQIKDMNATCESLDKLIDAKEARLASRSPIDEVD